MKTIEFIKAYSRVCRMEYIPLQAPGVFVPLFIAATSFQDLLNLYVVEALVNFYVIIF